MTVEATKAVDWALDWPGWKTERLCRHVAQYGANNWQRLAKVLNCHVRLVELKWHVLLVRAAHQLELLATGKAPDWDTWELGVLRRILDAYKGSGYSDAKIYQIIATWLPGRSHFGAKQAYIKYIKPHVSSNKDSTEALQAGLPHTVIGTLMEWRGVQNHHQACLHLSAQQVADSLLHQAPELPTSAPESKAATVSQTASCRKRKSTADPVHPGVPQQHMEQATASTHLPTYQVQYNTYLGAGAAAAGGTTDTFWLPLGSPGLSSSSSMASSSGILPLGTPAANTVCDLATLQQLLSQTPNAALTVLTGRESYSSCSSPGADGLGSSRSTGTAVTTSGLSFNSLLEQYSASQHYQIAPQQQEGAPTRRKRSRLSESTAVQQCAQQGSAAAASGANSVTVPGHGLVAYNMLEYQAVCSQPWVLEPVLSTSGGVLQNDLTARTTTAAAAESAAAAAAAGPRPLMPASCGSFDSTAAGQLTGDQLAAVCGWTSAWYGAAQQLQAGAAETSGPAPAYYAATGYHARMPGSAAAAPGSQQPQLSTPPQQQRALDSLVGGAAGSGDAAARSGGALAAAACETAAVQLPAHTSSGWYSSQLVQEDSQQVQPLACMGFEAVAAATVLPDCQQAAESVAFSADNVRQETVNLLHTAYENWMQMEKQGHMAELTPSNRGSARLSTDDNFCLPGLKELLAADAESVMMVADPDREHGCRGELIFKAIDSDSISEKLLEADDSSDFETELGLHDWLEL